LYLGVAKEEKKYGIIDKKKSEKSPLKQESRIPQLKVKEEPHRESSDRKYGGRKHHRSRSRDRKRTRSSSDSDSRDRRKKGSFIRHIIFPGPE